MPSGTLQFSLRSRVISGLVGQQSVYCLVYPGEPGADPPPGVYKVSAPIQNPVYGTVLLLALEEQIRQPEAAVALQGAHASFFLPAAQSVRESALQPETAFQGAHASFFLPAVQSVRESALQPGAASLFAMSNQRSRAASLVAGAGFEALAAALRQSGGANLVVR